MLQTPNGVKCLVICLTFLHSTRSLKTLRNVQLAGSSAQNEQAELPTNPSFQKLRYDPTFVDKTGFIKVFLEQSDEHIYAMAPACFGKSHLLDMLGVFLESQPVLHNSTVQASATKEYKLFEGTEIFKERQFFDKHVQKYQVIRLDCRPYLEVKDFESFQRRHCQVICQMMSRHKHLRNAHSNFTWLDHLDNEEKCSTYCLANFEMVGYAGRDLSRELQKTYTPNPVIFLGDGYDSVFRGLVASNVTDSKRILNKFVNFISRIVKRNNCTSRSLMLGTLNFGGVHPHLANNVKYINFNFKPDFAPYFGFTRKEVKRLLRTFNKTHAFDSVTDCYGGFRVKGARTELYNPFSVLEFLKGGGLKNYWLQKAPSLDHFKNLFTYPPIGDIIQDTLFGDSGLHCFFEDRLTLQHIESMKKFAGKFFSRVPRDTVINPFIRYLTQIGYFALRPSGPFEGDYLKVPNLETEQYVEKFLYESDYILKAVGVTSAYTERLADAFLGLTKNESYFQELSDVIYEVTKKNPPSDYTRPTVLGYLYAALKRPVNRRKFQVVKARVKVVTNAAGERNMRNERVDLVLITPDNTGIILKFKLEESSYVNLKIIIKRRYFRVFEQKFKNFKLSQIIYIGLGVKEAGECGLCYNRNTTDLEMNQWVASPMGKKKPHK